MEAIMTKKKKKPITFKQYAKFVTKLASKQSMKNFQSRLNTSGLGLAGEAGEVADLIKKLTLHGMKWNEEVRKKLVNEVGDILWYIAFTAHNVLDVSIEEIMQANVDKLKLRYKGGKFTTKEFMKKEDCKKAA
jgi:NTP pyrophosphatase (non-canonical NTP hydrolase)